MASITKFASGSLIACVMVAQVGVPAPASVPCTTSPIQNQKPNQPCLDQASIARQAAERRKFEAEQARKREEARRQQQLDQQRRQQEAARRQQEIADYNRRQMEQRRLAEQQRQAQLNAEVRSPGAIRVQSFAGVANRPTASIYNNTSVGLNVYISYHLRGENGAYYNGEMRVHVSGRSTIEWPYHAGPVDTAKRWNLQNTNVRWERAGY